MACCLCAAVETAICCGPDKAKMMITFEGAFDCMADWLVFFLYCSDRCWHAAWPAVRSGRLVHAKRSAVCNCWLGYIRHSTTMWDIVSDGMSETAANSMAFVWQKRRVWTIYGLITFVAVFGRRRVYDFSPLYTDSPVTHAMSIDLIVETLPSDFIIIIWICCFSFIIMFEVPKMIATHSDPRTSHTFRVDDTHTFLHRGCDEIQYTSTYYPHYNIFLNIEWKRKFCRYSCLRQYRLIVHRISSHSSTRTFSNGNGYRQQSWEQNVCFHSIQLSSQNNCQLFVCSSSMCEVAVCLFSWTFGSSDFIKRKYCSAYWSLTNIEQQ